jgi:hypothetical protein
MSQQPRGEAADYYQSQAGYSANQPYQNSQQGVESENKYTQQPPSYGYQNGMPQDQKPTFDQAFNIDKPKWNDLWAGLLVGANWTIHHLSAGLQY